MHRIYTYITEFMLTIYSVVLREAFIYQNKSVVMSRVENGDQSKRERVYVYSRRIRLFRQEGGAEENLRIAHDRRRDLSDMLLSPAAAVTAGLQDLVSLITPSHIFCLWIK